MRNQQEFVELIDRYRLGEARRLLIGQSFCPDYSSVATALLLTEGRGKCLRPRWIEHRDFALPETIQRACCQLARRQVDEIGELVQLRNDLSAQLAISARQAIAISGNNEKRLLAICVNDPGIWLSEYDGAVSWEPMISPSTLAAQTGLSVIDGLPLQDLASGGRGWPLAPLAWWLLFADRDRKVASTARILVRWQATCQFACLPESDGLDNEVPEIRFQEIPGARFETDLLNACGFADLDIAERDRLGAAGGVAEPLATFWGTEFLTNPGDWTCATTGQPLLDRSIEIIRQNSLGAGEIIRTLANQIARQLVRFADDHLATGRRGELVAGGDLNSRGLLVNEIDRQFSVTWFDGCGVNYQPASLDAITAAMTGLMHIDQMPVSVPWLTGCRLPRVAGRLTPGSPASFRRLIMEMGDSQPPVMKLRDAV